VETELTAALSNEALTLPFPSTDLISSVYDTRTDLMSLSSFLLPYSYLVLVHTIAEKLIIIAQSYRQCNTSVHHPNYLKAPKQVPGFGDCQSVDQIDFVGTQIYVSAPASRATGLMQCKIQSLAL